MNKTGTYSISKAIKKQRDPFFLTLMLVIIGCIYITVLSGKLWLKWDMYTAIFPLSVSVSSSLKHGALPLWEFYQYRGVPISHLLGFPTWSPLTIIFGLLGYNLYMMQLQFMLIVFISAIFTYYSVKLHTSNRFICVFSGVTYATSGLFVANAEHITFIFAAAVFPMLYFGYQKWLATLSYRWAVFVGFSIGLLILNNYPPFLAMSLLFLLIDFLFGLKNILVRLKGRWSLFLGEALLVVLAGVGVGFVALYTTFEVLPHITRSSMTYELASSASLSLWNWISSLTPGFNQIQSSLILNSNVSMTNTYLAVPVILLAFLKMPKSKKEYGIWFQIVLSFFISMGKYTIVYKILYHALPSISAHRFPAGFRYFIFFFIIIIASINADKLIGDAILVERFKKIVQRYASLLGVLFVIFVSFRLFEVTGVALPPRILTELTISIIVIIAFYLSLSYFQKKNKLAEILLVIVCFFSVIAVWRNDEYTIGVKEKPETYASHIDNVYKNKGIQVQNRFTVEKPFSTGDTTFTKQFQTGGYVGSFFLKNFEEAQQQGLLPKEGDPVIWFSEDEKYKVPDGLLLSKESAKVPIDSPILSSPNRMSFSVTTESSGYLVFEQSFFPGWKVSVDGEKRDLVKTDSGVLSVAIEDGTHYVEFFFSPTGTRLAAYFTFLVWGVVFLIGLFGFVKMKKG